LGEPENCRQLQAVAISPDNHWVVTGSGDKTARLWLLQVEDLIYLARATVGRNLSTDEWLAYFPPRGVSQDVSRTTGARLEKITQDNFPNHMKMLCYFCRGV
jgi:WD40 repeat protein